MKIEEIWPDLSEVADHFRYDNARKNKVLMPLGGIGAGGIGLSGNGRLIDWNIANRPRMGHYNGYSHFAIKASNTQGEVLDARVLNGPYDGDAVGAFGHARFNGYGIGATWGALAGLPHFQNASFIGRFPLADITFQDDAFPGLVRLGAFSPFVAHQSRDSSFPAAMFEFEIVNSSDAELCYEIAGTLGALDMEASEHQPFVGDGMAGLTIKDARSSGALALSVSDPDAQIVPHHHRGQWFDALRTYWQEFSSEFGLKSRHHETKRNNPNMFGQPEHGSVVSKFVLKPGERAKAKFAINWYFPKGDIYWYERKNPAAPNFAGEAPQWINAYASIWPDVEDVANEIHVRWDELKRATQALPDLFHGSDLPAEITDAALSTLAVLRSPTVSRLQDGTLWSWEGTFENEGSCEGSCTHVWNYAQALPFLFPDLEATYRHAEWNYNQQPDGGLTFRQRLPLGSGLDVIGPCADGHFGAIIKTYRDWRATGEASLVNAHWPKIKKAIEYAWSADNPNQWDPDQTGLLWGKQHHTLDMELFGPNAWLSGLYVTALFAGAEMANFMGDAEFAQKCKNIAENGAARISNELFNGSYFHQAMDLKDKTILQPYNSHAAGVLEDGFEQTYWDDEAGELKYQTGNDCLTDQLLGHWHAQICGLPPMAETHKITEAVEAIFARNFRENLNQVVNPNRVYGYENEGGLLLSTSGEGGPKYAVPYAEEVWTGLEYMFAYLLLAEGRKADALHLMKTVRQRCDGTKRNPYSDIECGNYYARSMSAFALVNLCAGLRVDAVAQALFLRKPPLGEGRFPFVTATATGTIHWQGDVAEIRIKSGNLLVFKLQAEHGLLFADGASQIDCDQTNFSTGSKIFVPLNQHD